MKDATRACLRLAVFCLYIGYGITFLRGGLSLEFVSWNGLNLNPSAESILFLQTNDGLHNKLAGIIGLLMLFASGIVALKVNGTVLKLALILGGLCLAIHHLSLYARTVPDVFHLVEASLRVGTPFLLLATLLTTRTLIPMTILIALTFVGHGVYALGLWRPVPGAYIDMVILTFHVRESTARILLQIAGSLDLLAAALVLLRLPKAFSVSVVYCMTWGFITALARLYVNTHFQDLGQALSEIAMWLPEMLVRMPHALVPAAILLQIYNKKSKSEAVAQARAIAAS